MLRARIANDPRDAIGWILLADAELDAGDIAAGATACERALALAPGHPEALARLGRAQWMRGAHADAAHSLRQAAQAAPDHPGIALWLGHALEDAGQAEAAAEAYARAHALAPGEPYIAAQLLAWRRKLCDWRDLDALSAQVRAAVRDGSAPVEPFAFLSEDTTPAEQLQCARLRADPIARSTRQLSSPPVAASDAPVRAGFLSNGFGAHPTGLLTVALFEALRAQGDIELQLFALNPDDGSPIRQRLAHAAHALHDVHGQAHRAIAQTIREAGIEVLFDLRGWGGGGVPEVLAQRPAPVQVNWLAYPGTSGAPWIDYILADRFVLPADTAAGFSEVVAWLPGCFQPSDTTRALPASPSREACGLPSDATVLCCFNNSYKLNPRSMQRAFAILREAPPAVLWLLSGPGRADDRLREAARGAGIDPARLVFMAKQPHAEYLARLQLADLFLDTHPYNAHTTASDALWASCPVLTTPGTTFASRVAGSLNHHLGLRGMNMDDDAAFVQRAVALCRDAAARTDLRWQLADARAQSPLFDMPAMATGFAATVREMAARHRRGLPPAPLG